MQILANRLSREARIRIRERAETLRQRRADGEVTAKHLDVLDILLLANDSNSSTAKTIAAEAGCARSTLYEAVKALEAAGILIMGDQLWGGPADLGHAARAPRAPLALSRCRWRRALLSELREARAAELGESHR
jgi:hypothetical protein